MRRLPINILSGIPRAFIGFSLTDSHPLLEAYSLHLFSIVFSSIPNTLQYIPIENIIVLENGVPSKTRKRTKTATFTLPSALLDDVTAFAKLSYRTKSGTVQMLLERGLEAATRDREDGDPDLDENAA